MLSLVKLSLYYSMEVTVLVMSIFVLGCKESYSKTSSKRKK